MVKDRRKKELQDHIAEDLKEEEAHNKRAAARRTKRRQIVETSKIVAKKVGKEAVRLWKHHYKQKSNKKGSTKTRDLAIHLNQTFPEHDVKISNVEIKQYRDGLDDDDLKRSDKVDADQAQLSALIYHPPREATEDRVATRDYFNGRFATKLDNGQFGTISAVNPEWVEYVFSPVFVEIVKKGVRNWWPIPLGNARITKDVAPSHLMTKIRLKYTQNDRNQCLFTASALHYVGLIVEATVFSMKAPTVEYVSGDVAILELKKVMKQVAPVIGDCVVYNKLNRRRKINRLTLDEILGTKTEFPTVVIPLGLDKSCTHAICVVDDLIFDSTQSRALKLTKESLDWIVGGKGIDKIYEAYRFSRANGAKKKKFTHKMKKNW